MIPLQISSALLSAYLPIITSTASGILIPVI